MRRLLRRPSRSLVTSSGTLRRRSRSSGHRRQNCSRAFSPARETHPGSPLPPPRRHPPAAAAAAGLRRLRPHAHRHRPRRQHPQTQPSQTTGLLSGLPRLRQRPSPRPHRGRHQPHPPTPRQLPQLPQLNQPTDPSPQRNTRPRRLSRPPKIRAPHQTRRKTRTHHPGPRHPDRHPKRLEHTPHQTRAQNPGTPTHPRLTHSGATNTHLTRVTPANVWEATGPPSGD